LSSLSAPRMTTLRASAGSGRCSTFASSHGARIQTSRSSSVARITDHGHCLGMDRLHHGVRLGRQEAVDLMRSGDRLRLGPTISVERGPDASEGEQRPIVIEREPHHVFLLGLGVRLWRVLGEAVGRNEAAVLRFEPYPPVRSKNRSSSPSRAQGSPPTKSRTGSISPRTFQRPRSENWIARFFEIH